MNQHYGYNNMLSFLFINTDQSCAFNVIEMNILYVGLLMNPSKSEVLVAWRVQDPTQKPNI